MRTVLITGGAGFVGRHFTEFFLKLGDHVFCVDSLAKFTGQQPPDRWYFHPNQFSNFRFYREDCRMFFHRRTLPKFDLVLHLAAMVGGRLMIENNPLAVADDLSIDSGFWQWAIRAKPAKILTFSSSAVYPIKFQTKHRSVLLEEEMIRFESDLGMPDMTYGWAKLTAEYMGILAYKKYGIKSVAYRPFSGYGNDQDLSYPIPAIMKRIKHMHGDEIEIWGSGHQRRDFIHIDDCVRGVVKTMGKIDDGSALNLSTGRLTSFNELVAIAGVVLGKKIKAKPKTSRPEGVFARGGDTVKQKKLGFVAKTTLEEGIQRFFEV